MAVSKAIQIQDSDRLHACRKWLGVVGENEAVANASDAEFVSRFKRDAGRITGSLIGRFAAMNNDKTARKTGGYSVIRRFKGGADVRAPQIDAFLRGPAVSDARFQFSKSLNQPAALFDLTGELAAFHDGDRNYPLGISAASKLLFFTCTEMPFFIYDSFVQEFLGCKIARDAKGYELYWHRCFDALQSPFHIDTDLPPENPSWPGLPERDWFKRRCLDLAMYRAQQTRR